MVLAQVMFEWGAEQRSGVGILVGIVIVILILGSTKKK